MSPSSAVVYELVLFDVVTVPSVCFRVETVYILDKRSQISANQGRRAGSCFQQSEMSVQISSPIPLGLVGRSPSGISRGAFESRH